MKTYKECIFFLLLISIPISVTINPMADFNYNGCFKTFTKTGPDLIITSPNFPLPYDYNKDCGWLIETQENAAHFNITFHYFDVEPSKDCSKYDYVMVFQQQMDQDVWDIAKNPGTGEPQTHGYCGKMKPFYVADKVKRMFVLFHSDNSNKKTGFNATFDMLIIPGPAKITVLGQGKGEYVLVVKNITAYAEQRGVVTLSCKADASPPAEYNWFKVNEAGDREKLRDDLVKVRHPNGTIQFHELQLEDAGIYRCVASNGPGKEDEKDLTLLVAEKCLCKPKYNISWFPKPPYTKYEDNGVTKGVFYAILKDMFDYICGNCTMGHGPTEIEWIEYTKSEVSKKERSLDNLKVDIENDVADIYLPIENYKTVSVYRNTKYFFSLLDSPGVALVVIGPEEGAIAKKLFASIFQGWPIFVLVIVMAVLAGIVMWILDTYWNEDQFPRAFAEGVVEGTWWAFITMTTVGYGDIAPVGVPGRIFGVLWILTGLVVISIFTGVISTSLTVIALSTDVKLYGTDVGALENSAEYRMGVIKNANMKTFSTYSELKAAMSRREVKGSLIDAYVTAYEKDLFSSFRINNIFSGNKAFGIVLGKALESKEILTKIDAYKENQGSKIISLIEANVPPQPTPIEAESSSEELFKPSNQMFVSSMTTSCIMLVAMTILGLCYQYGFLVPRQKKIEAAKNLDVVDSKRAKQIDRQLKQIRESLVAEVHGFYQQWDSRVQGLSNKHNAEQEQFMQRGKAQSPVPSSQQSVRSFATASSSEEGHEETEMKSRITQDSKNPIADEASDETFA